MEMKFLKLLFFVSFLLNNSQAQVRKGCNNCDTNYDACVSENQYAKCRTISPGRRMVALETVKSCPEGSNCFLGTCSRMLPSSCVVCGSCNHEDGIACINKTAYYACTNWQPDRRIHICPEDEFCDSIGGTPTFPCKSKIDDVDVPTCNFVTEEEPASTTIENSTPSESSSTFSTTEDPSSTSEDPSSTSEDPSSTSDDPSSTTTTTEATTATSEEPSSSTTTPETTTATSEEPSSTTTTPETTTATSENPVNEALQELLIRKCCDEAEGTTYIFHPEDTTRSKYVECFKSTEALKATEVSCPPNTFFDPIQKSCTP